MKITHEQRQTRYLKFHVEMENTDTLPVAAVCTNCLLEARACKKTVNSEQGKIFAMVSLMSDEVINFRKIDDAKTNCGVDIQ